MYILGGVIGLQRDCRVKEKAGWAMFWDGTLVGGRGKLEVFPDWPYESASDTLEMHLRKMWVGREHQNECAYQLRRVLSISWDAEARWRTSLRNSQLYCSRTAQVTMVVWRWRMGLANEPMASEEVKWWLTVLSRTVAGAGIWAVTSCVFCQQDWAGRPWLCVESWGDMLMCRSFISASTLVTVVKGRRGTGQGVISFVLLWICELEEWAGLWRLCPSPLTPLLSPFCSFCSPFFALVLGIETWGPCMLYYWARHPPVPTFSTSALWHHVLVIYLCT